MIDSPYFRAVFLGIVQGIAEFLPVSSSGHLVILDEILQRVRGVKTGAEDNLQMNIALHVGTLFSILVVYRHNLLRLLKQPRLMFFIVVATLPLVGIGLSPLKDVVEHLFETPIYAGCGLLLTALLLAMGQRLERDEKSIEEMQVWHPVVIGLFQAVAILPGVSRSGSTIAAGLLTGMQRQAAATFSFFIAIPAIAGGALLMVIKFVKSPVNEPLHWEPLLVGGICSFFVGWFALRWLLRIIAKGGLRFFAIYCFIVGTATIIWQIISPAA